LRNIERAALRTKNLMNGHEKSQERSQVVNEIANRVKVFTKRSTKLLEENTGIQTQLEDDDVNEYIRAVVEEREKMMKRTDSASESKG
jgi:hypothetical protein